MLKVVCSGVFLTVALSLSPVAMAQGVDCGADASQCVDVCEGEKTWGFLKGKKFRDCAVRCEEQLARQCKSKAQDSSAARSGEGRDDKVHPQGKEYGYEKNADKVKGQQGAAMSAAHGKDQVEEKGTELHEHDLDAEAEEMKEKAEKVEKEKAKGKAKGKGKDKAQREKE